MKTPRSTIWAERLIFFAAIFVGTYFVCEYIYRMGFAHGQVTRVCAVVPGEKVVSTTAGTCTYANAYGLATKKRRAM